MITLFCIRPKGFNIGNDVIFLGMQHFLYEAFGQAVNLISLPATSRYESQQVVAGLTAKTIYEINQYGHGVIVGGGNLYENGELDVDLDALKSLEVPLMLFSLSRGRVYNRQHKLVSRTDAMPDQVVLALNHRAEHSLARDCATDTYLQAIGCNHSQVSGCPTIFLDKIVERLPRISSSDQLGALISVRNPTLMNIPLQKQSQVRGDILGIVEFLHSEGIENVHLLCHDRRDIAFAASFAGIDYLYTDDVYTYLAWLRSCRLNISYRLHATLPCLAFGVPTIKIGYDERGLSLMETLGLGIWSINMIDSVDVVSEVADRFWHLDVLKTLQGQVQPGWDQLYEVITTAFQKFAAAVLAYQGE